MLKNFIAVVVMILCFGVAKAHILPKSTAGLKLNITIIPINNLADYNVTFRFIAKPYYAKKEMISVQNKIAIPVNETAIEKNESTCVRITLPRKRNT